MRVKPIRGYPGYCIADDGTVFSRRNGKPMKPDKINGGYLRVGLYNPSTKSTKRILVHRLVAEAFVPNPKGNLYVNHIDEDKENNRAENLEWVTFSENINHGTRNARAALKNGKKVRNVETGEIFNSHTAAANSVGRSSCHLTEILGRQNRTCGGFHWESL